jgi:hypothetical protein
MSNTTPNKYGRTAASVARLQEIKDVTEEEAERIRFVWKNTAKRQDAREEIDSILRTCGVELLGAHTSDGAAVHYCNAGDTYATTVLFHQHHLTVGCIGDFVERKLVKEFQQP